MVNLMLTTMQDLRPIPPPLKRKEDILLFFKLYDPVKEELWYFTFLSSDWRCMSFIKAFFSPTLVGYQGCFSILSATLGGCL